MSKPIPEKNGKQDTRKIIYKVTSAVRRGHKQYVTILTLANNVFLPACGQGEKGAGNEDMRNLRKRIQTKTERAKIL